MNRWLRDRHSNRTPPLQTTLSCKNREKWINQWPGYGRLCTIAQTGKQKSKREKTNQHTVIMQEKKFSTVDMVGCRSTCGQYKFTMNALVELLIYEPIFLLYLLVHKPSNHFFLSHTQRNPPIAVRVGCVPQVSHTEKKA